MPPQFLLLDVAIPKAIANDPTSLGVSVAIILAMAGIIVRFIKRAETDLLRRIAKAEGETAVLSQRLDAHILQDTREFGKITGDIQRHADTLEVIRKQLADTLDEELFRAETKAQNALIENVAGQVADVRENLRAIDRGLRSAQGARYESGSMTAVRAPPRRNDGPYESEPPVPPMRPRSPSRPR